MTTIRFPSWLRVAAIALAAAAIVGALRLPTRASAPTGRYVVGNGSVRDTLTNLTWQQVPSIEYNWADAKANCASLTLNGTAGWRLPTVKELLTLIDVSEIDLPIDPNAFPGTPDRLFWTSTPYADPFPQNSPAAWVVDFTSSTDNAGITNKDVSFYQFPARCVR